MTVHSTTPSHAFMKGTVLPVQTPKCPGRCVCLHACVHTNQSKCIHSTRCNAFVHLRFLPLISIYLSYPIFMLSKQTTCPKDALTCLFKAIVGCIFNMSSIYYYKTLRVHYSRLGLSYVKVHCSILGLYSVKVHCSTLGLQCESALVHFWSPM